MKNCKYCGKPVVLVPSAAERARKDVTGKTAAYYTSLFPYHARCMAEMNRAQFKAEDTQGGNNAAPVSEAP